MDEGRCPRAFRVGGHCLHGFGRLGGSFPHHCWQPCRHGPWLCCLLFRLCSLHLCLSLRLNGGLVSHLHGRLLCRGLMLCPHGCLLLCLHGCSCLLLCAHGLLLCLQGCLLLLRLHGRLLLYLHGFLPLRLHGLLLRLLCLQGCLLLLCLHGRLLLCLHGRLPLCLHGLLLRLYGCLLLCLHGRLLLSPQGPGARVFPCFPLVHGHSLMNCGHKMRVYLSNRGMGGLWRLL